MYKHILFLLILSFSNKIYSQDLALNSPYLYFGEVPPTNTPKIFGKGLISTKNNHEFSCTFSADGKEFYFNRGLKIYYTQLIDSIWSPPAIVPFIEDYKAHEPYITKDNSRMYFGFWKPHEENKPDHYSYGIWETQRNKIGWNEPQYVGYAMYVTSTGKDRFYYTHVENPDNIFIVSSKINKGRFTKTKKQKGGLLTPEESRLPGRHPCISKNGDYLIFDSYDLNGDNAQLFICFKTGKNKWSKALKLNDKINFAKEHICPTLSPDEKYLFYHANGDIYWVSTSFIKPLKNKLK